MSIPIAVFTRIAARDLAPVPDRAHDVDVHVGAAIDWLCRAHDQPGDDGVSYGYSLRGGWRPSYIETTGYIACTFFNLAHLMHKAEYRERAIRMVHWLRSVQNDDGSFSNPNYADGSGIVFDTGQDLFGLVRAWHETKDEVFLESARRAGEWLVRVADETGRWTQNTHLSIPHVYNSRVAWALLELHDAAPTPEFLRVARANLDWAASEQREGWFDSCAFALVVAPFTHTIAYAIRGLWESSRIVADDAWERAAIRGADVVLSRLTTEGFLPGQIDVDGRPAARYCCLTGNAQMAIVWTKLHAHTGELRYRDAAIKATRYVMRTQDIETTDLDVRGAIKGSQPIWGRYSPFTYPNWATKFFLDALLGVRDWT